MALILDELLSNASSSFDCQKPYNHTDCMAFSHLRALTYVSFQILCYGCSVITLWTGILHTKVSSIFMVFQVGFSRIIFVANVTLISFLTLWTVRSSVMLRETRIVAYPGTHWTFCTWLGVFSTNVTFQGLSIWSHN